MSKKGKKNVIMTSIMTDDEIKEIKKYQLQQHQQQQKKRKKKKEIYDFISIILIYGTIDDILKLTKYLIKILNYDDKQQFKYPYEYEEALFSNHQPIVIEHNSYLNYINEISFKLYYNDIYNDALNFNNERLKLNNKNEISINKASSSFNINNEEEDDEKKEDDDDDEYLLYQKKTLLRLCFLIAFIKDVRINRFVMAYHSIHSNLKTKAPLRDKTIRFIEKSTYYIDYFLKNQTKINDFSDISDIIDNCINLWFNYYIMSRIVTDYNEMEIERNEKKDE
jgi:hypothetical protein